MHDDAIVERVLLASLHQAIAEVLPARLEFYEKWLKAPELDSPELDAASFTAMLGSLRNEGDVSDLVVSRAGQHAGARSFEKLFVLTRAYLRVLPRRMRARRAVRLVVAFLPALYPETRADMIQRGGTVFIGIDGSPFCSARGPAIHPSCDFYSSAIETFLTRFKLHPAVRVSRCRASGSKSCLFMVLPDQARSVVSPESSLAHLADDMVTPPPADMQVEVPPPDAPACVPEVLPPTVGPETKSEIEAGLDAITKVFVRPTVENDPEEPWHRL